MKSYLPLRAINLKAPQLAPLLAMLSCWPGLALGQSRDHILYEPSTAAIERLGRQGITSKDAPAIAAGVNASSVGGEAKLNFNIQFTEAKIFNPRTDRYDSVRLRSYRDAHETVPPVVPFVAPTIEVSPGETVRISLANNLPANPNCLPVGSGINKPHCFNRTNLHAHGLWVSPTGNSDNVLLSINPGVDFQYEYNIPVDHPAGTFWYHPHLHGSTALQVSSGMAGVLIVRGNRPPGPGAKGDIDTLLKRPDGTPFRERLVLLQQIQYACRNQLEEIKTQKDGQGQVVAWICDPGDVGEITDYDQFGPPTWKQSGRYTSINGEVIPVFTGAQAGEIERWRIVHAGVRDTVNLQFKKMRPGAQAFARLTETQEQDWVAQNCTGETLLPQFALATDGLTRPQIVERVTTTMQPGYREDILVVFPEAADYCVLDNQAPPESTVNGLGKSRQFLGRVAVAAGHQVSDARNHIQKELIAAVERFMPLAVRQKIRDELADGLRLKSFGPHDDIENTELTGAQTAEMKVNVTAGGVTFQIDGESYNPKEFRRLKLGGVDEWTLSAFPNAGHPFHIHVNAFQIWKILNPGGADVSVDGEQNDAQYANLKGVWKDTIFVKPGYKVVMRTRYRRYIGDFVLHCHILDHEDKGMMQNVRIVVPPGDGELAASHH